MKKILLIVLLAFSFNAQAETTNTIRDIEEILLIHDQKIHELIKDRNHNVATFNATVNIYDKKFAIMAAKVEELEARIIELERKIGAQTKW